MHTVLKIKAQKTSGREGLMRRLDMNNFICVSGVYDRLCQGPSESPRPSAGLSGCPPPNKTSVAVVVVAATASENMWIHHGGAWGRQEFQLFDIGTNLYEWLDLCVLLMGLCLYF